MYGPSVLGDADRFLVCAAITHLHLGSMIGMGLEPGDWKSVKRHLTNLFDELQVPVGPEDPTQVRAKIINGVTKTILELDPADNSLSLDVPAMVSAIILAHPRRRPVKKPCADSRL